MKCLPLVLLAACVVEERGIEVTASFHSGESQMHTTVLLRSVALVACPTPARHGSEDPLVLEPHAVVTSSRPIIELGTLTPPAGHYCSVIVKSGIAEEDAHDVTAEIIGKSAVIHRNERTYESTLAFEREEIVDLVLDDKGDRVSIELSFDDAVLGTALDAVLGDESEGTRNALRDSLRITVTH